MKALPGAVWVDKKGTTFQKFAKALSADALKTAVFDGDETAEGTLIYDKPKADGGKVIGFVMDGTPTKGFATASRKVEFFAKGLQGKTDAAGKPVDPLPVFEPRDWMPDDAYPLYLINWKEASPTHSPTFHNPSLLELKPNNPLIVHRTPRRSSG